MVYIQAIVPEHVHPERCSAKMAEARMDVINSSPFPSSIVRKQAGQRYPDSDPENAAEYFGRSTECTRYLIEDQIRTWDLAGIYR